MLSVKVGSDRDHVVACFQILELLPTTSIIWDSELDLV